jgi:prevent-host-death family protein
MRVLSATDVKQGFGAAQREPVLIKKQNREVAVLLSIEEFDKLRGLRLQAFDQLCDAIAAKIEARGLTDKVFETILDDVS